MNQTVYRIVVDVNGQRGIIDAAHMKGQVERVTVLVDGGKQVSVPVQDLVKRNDGLYYLPVSLDSFNEVHVNNHEVTQTQDGIVIPLVREEIHVGKQWVETGHVRISKVLREEEQVVDEPLLQEFVEVERVPVNRVLDEPVTTRREGDRLIIPVVEEVLVVQKRLVLKEEIHVIRRQTETHDPQTVTVRREEVVVERTNAK